jgi:hypothetical protein
MILRPVIIGPIMERDFLVAVAERFLSEARSFIDEIIQGTDKYRQLQSLSHQIPHDYQGRFLIKFFINCILGARRGICIGERYASPLTRKVEGLVRSLGMEGISKSEATYLHSALGNKAPNTFEREFRINQLTL